MGGIIGSVYVYIHLFPCAVRIGRVSIPQDAARNRSTGKVVFCLSITSLILYASMCVIRRGSGRKSLVVIT